MGSLLVGVMTAESAFPRMECSYCSSQSLEGHLFANVVTNKDLKTPFLSVIVSGGHYRNYFGKENLVVIYYWVVPEMMLQEKHMTRYPRFLALVIRVDLQ